MSSLLQGDESGRKDDSLGWLVLLFSLPTKQATPRVEIWRKLRSYGALALPGAGHLLPFSADNQERLEWLAATIRDYKGEASVMEVRRIDSLSDERIAQLFRELRGKEYQALLRDLQAAQKSGSALRKMAVFKRRFEEIASIDYFTSPIRAQVEAALADLRAIPSKAQIVRIRAKGEFANKRWVTRPRPGIDRVSSAWLIRNFIDPKAKFLFAKDAAEHPDAVAFDMFGDAGFGHQGEYCTFETLMKSFNLTDRRIEAIAEIVHDADLADGKFGRVEGLAIELVLAGWEIQETPDADLLKRGMELIDGLYRGLKKRT
jgi:hypothetical protein